MKSLLYAAAAVLFLAFLGTILAGIYVYANAGKIVGETFSTDPDIRFCQEKFGPESTYRLNKHGDPYCVNKKGQANK